MGVESRTNQAEQDVAADRAGITASQGISSSPPALLLSLVFGEGGDAMRQVPGRPLWLGNAGDLRDARTVLAAGSVAVVELADSEPFAALPRELVRCRFPLCDGGDNSPWLMRLAVESVAAFLRASVPAVVCCSAGMSRSVCVAAGGVALAEDRSLAECLAVVVKCGPADVSPGLLFQLQRVLGA